MTETKPEPIVPWPTEWESAACALLPPLPSDNVPRGFVASGHGVTDPKVWLSQAQLMPVGLEPSIAQGGWQLERVAGQPNLLRVAHQDDVELQPLASAQMLPTERFADGGLLCDLAELPLGVEAVGRGQALWLQQHADAVQLVLLVKPNRQVAPLELAPEVPCPIDAAALVVAAGDPWLAEQARLAAQDGRLAGDWQALAMVWRWQLPVPDLRGVDPLEGAVLAWARAAPPVGLARLVRSALLLADSWHRDVEALLEEPAVDDPSWLAALDDLLTARDILQGLCNLAVLAGSGQALVDDLRLLDDTSARPIALMSEGPADEREAARRSWLADPTSWWARLYERRLLAQMDLR